MGIICQVNGKIFHKGKKVRVRYPAMTSGYIEYIFCSKKAAKEHIKNIDSWQQNRAIMKEVK